MGRLWEQSGQIARDNNDQRAVGAKAYFFAGGTGSTPYVVYEDAAESTPHEHPVEADGNGRWPAVFIPFTTSYDVQVKTSGGTQLYFYTEIPNPNPVEQAEAGADPEELLATGHIHCELVNATKVGFVRLNGRTLGNAASGATERANADTSDLFTHLWNNLANGQAAVSGGRGASAAADYAANKTITLPDLRGAIPIGLDDMGNTAASLLGSAPFTNGNATTAGSLLGENTHALSAGEHAAHTHTFAATSSSDGSHTHTGTTDAAAANIIAHARQRNDTLGAGSTTFLTDSSSSLTTTSAWESSDSHSHTFTSAANGSHTHTISGTSGSQGSGTAHNVVQRGLLVTFYIKL